VAADSGGPGARGVALARPEQKSTALDPHGAEPGASAHGEATPVPSADAHGERKLMTINMGPQHPSTHGVLRLIVTLDGEVVVKVVPDIGYLHRNFEKIVEGWAYPGIVPFSDRNDYLGAITNEIAVCLAVEKLAEIEVPPRAVHLRVLFAELQRIISHVLFVGTFGMDLGAFTPFLYAFREREMGYTLMEKATGARMLYAYNRLGGLRNDVSEDWLREVEQYLDYLERQAWPEYMGLLIENEIYRERTIGVGRITQEQAIAWGASGPMLRATGVAWDLRKAAPYLCYDRFEFDVPVGQNGDTYDSAMVRMLEIKESARIIRQVLRALPDGPVLGKVRPNVRPRPGDVYSRVESPRGEVGVYLVSDGGGKPYRLKWRAPSFCHLQMLPTMCEGWKVADMIASVGSTDVIMGEVDR
jgi:NADH-quinone oxidoreductase subunit D